SSPTSSPSPYTTLFRSSVLLERLDLFDGNRSGNHAPRVRVVIEAVETIHEPFRNGSAAALRHPEHLRKARDRQNAGHDRCRDARSEEHTSELQSRENLV